MNDPTPLLDPDIVDALTAAQRPDDAAAHAAAVQRVRGRLMQRIAQDSVYHHIAIPADAGSHDCACAQYESTCCGVRPRP